jgi:hypothetical protein
VTATPTPHPEVARGASPEPSPIGEPDRATESPNPLRNLYFGEQHLHTQASPDSFAVGNRGTWEDAYNYAVGKEVTLSTTGEKMRKSTPYDFVGITDHAEYFGVMPRLVDPEDPLSKTEFGKALQDPKVDASAPTRPSINSFSRSSRARPPRNWSRPSCSPRAGRNT